jgi:hypothetical protein
MIKRFFIKLLEIYAHGLETNGRNLAAVYTAMWPNITKSHTTKESI